MPILISSRLSFIKYNKKKKFSFSFTKPPFAKKKGSDKTSKANKAIIFISKKYTNWFQIFLFRLTSSFVMKKNCNF